MPQEEPGQHEHEGGKASHGGYVNHQQPQISHYHLAPAAQQSTIRPRATAAEKQRLVVSDVTVFGCVGGFESARNAPLG